MNNITIMGRLTQQPEIKTVGDGIEKCDLSIAVDRYLGKDKERKTDFFRATVWRNTAAFVAKYFNKGDGIILSGSMENNPYDKDGVKRDSWSINVSNVEFPIGKSGKSGNVSEPEFTVDASDSSLPF